jgi:hypothetical protein
MSSGRVPVWLAERSRFPGLRATGEIVATREDKTGRAATRRRLFALSQPISANALLKTARSH